MPSYLTYRNSGACNLKANINSFEDLKKIGFSKPDIKNLKKVYENVKDIDLFTGGMLYQYCLYRITFSTQFILKNRNSSKWPGFEDLFREQRKLEAEVKKKKFKWKEFD